MLRLWDVLNVQVCRLQRIYCIGVGLIGIFLPSCQVLPGRGGNNCARGNRQQKSEKELILRKKFLRVTRAEAEQTPCEGVTSPSLGACKLLMHVSAGAQAALGATLFYSLLAVWSHVQLCFVKEG